MVEKADREERRYIERSKNIKIKLNKINEKFKVMQENNEESNENNLKEIFGDVGSDKNQVNNEEVSLEENLESNSGASEITKTILSKTIKCDSNLKSYKDKIAMNKQFAEQLAFYKDIQPSSRRMKEVETSGVNSQFDLQEADAELETGDKNISKEDGLSDENVGTGSDSSEIKETVPSKDIENDLNEGSKKNEVAMHEMFANQLSIYEKDKPNSDSKSVEKLNERKSITFSLVNNDLLEKYFKDDSKDQIQEPASDSVDDKNDKESNVNKCNDELVQESSFNILSVVSNDTGSNSNIDNQNKLSENSDNDDAVLSENSSMNNVENLKEGLSSEVNTKFSSDDIKWNLDSISTEGWFIVISICVCIIHRIL